MVEFKRYTTFETVSKMVAEILVPPTHFTRRFASAVYFSLSFLSAKCILQVGTSLNAQGGVIL